MKQKIASKLKALSACASEKNWLHITEDNDHSCCRILIRALKTARFTWIFVGNGSHAYKKPWAPPGLFLMFFLLTLLSKTLPTAETSKTLLTVEALFGAGPD